jgi:hypothetical protein
LSSLGLGGSVDLRVMERQTESRGQVTAKGEVRVGFGAAQAVVKMSGVENDAQFPALLMERAKQRDGVRTAGEADGEAQAGTEGRGIEGEG